MMYRSSSHGFTLIELMVVIALIGILAAVITRALFPARQRAQSTAIIANMSNARTQAALYYTDNDNSFDNVCTASNGILRFFNEVATKGGVQTTCHDTPGGWAMATRLPVLPHIWCVDAGGASRDYIGTGINKGLLYVSIGDTSSKSSFGPNGIVCQ